MSSVFVVYDYCDIVAIFTTEGLADRFVESQKTEGEDYHWKETQLDTVLGEDKRWRGK